MAEMKVGASGGWEMGEEEAWMFSYQTTQDNMMLQMCIYDFNETKSKDKNEQGLVVPPREKSLSTTRWCSWPLVDPAWAGPAGQAFLWSFG